jgi:transporter family-2 protein
VIFYIFLALLKGTFVGMSRTINARLSGQVGPFKASLSNHIVGFLFLTLMLLALGEWGFDPSPRPPLLAYLGGFFGALFVAVNSYVFPRVGAMNAALLVISGQMITAVLIDCAHRNISLSLTQLMGVAIILSGVYMTRVSSQVGARKKP